MFVGFSGDSERELGSEVGLIWAGGTPLGLRQGSGSGGGGEIASRKGGMLL